MKVLITGSQELGRVDLVATSVADAGFAIDQVIVRGDYDKGVLGVDRAAKEWAEAQNPPIPVRAIIPDIYDLNVPKAQPRMHKETRKMYNHHAGADANEQAIREADAVIVIWDGVSGGAKAVITAAENAKKHTWIVTIRSPAT